MQASSFQPMNVMVSQKREDPMMYQQQVSWDPNMEQHQVYFPPEKQNLSQGNNVLGFFSGESRNYWGNHILDWHWAEEQKKINSFSILATNHKKVFNVLDFIHKQIVFLEPSPVQKKLEQLKALGGTFEDNLFCADKKSLVGKDGFGSDHDEREFWKTIEWDRISNLIENPCIFNGKPLPSDINQGYLGDCYFLAGLAALAERPDRIFKLFLTKDINEQKYFEVKLLYKGKWMTIDIDEFVPTVEGTIAFSNTLNGALWVLILEKAWAKLYSNYKRIQAGFCQQAIHDLTGAPVKYINFNQQGFNKKQTWNYLVEASNKQYAMVAGTPGSGEQQNENNIVSGHAYTFLKATIINFKGNNEKIVLLRNPHGSGNQFAGKWSDGHSFWDHVSQYDKKRIQFNPKEEDGLFWMSYHDFINEFQDISVAEVLDNASYVYKTIKDESMEGVYFTLEIGLEGLYCLQIDHTPVRSFSLKQQKKFEYPELEMQIAKFQQQKCEVIEDYEIQGERTQFAKVKFQPGKYIVWIKVLFNQNYEKDYDVNLAVYSETVCLIRESSHDEVALYQQDQGVEWYGDHEADD